jgi:hypothetical protein
MDKYERSQPRFHPTKNRSSRFGVLFLPVVLFALFFFPRNAAIAEPVRVQDARALRMLEELDDLYRSASSYSILTMRVKTAHYTRTMAMEGWSKGKDKSLMRITSPRKEKGTATLKSGNSIYTYLPKTDRTIRLTSGMMMGSWMGSHFTNDDLVKESRLSEDYDPAITFEGDRDGTAIVEFTLFPKPDAPVVWDKIVTTIRAADHIPVSSLYYDEDMVLARTLTFSGIKEMGGRLLPAVMLVVPADNPEEYTEIVYERIDFDMALGDSFFSLMQLRRK